MYILILKLDSNFKEVSNFFGKGYIQLHMKLSAIVAKHLSIPNLKTVIHFSSNIAYKVPELDRQMFNSICCRRT